MTEIKLLLEVLFLAVGGLCGILALVILFLILTADSRYIQVNLRKPFFLCAGIFLVSYSILGIASLFD